MAIITTAADTGNGGGFSSAQGAIQPAVNQVLTNMSTRFMISDFFDSAGCIAPCADEKPPPFPVSAAVVIIAISLPPS
jgi:hypothetical protein